MDRHDKDTIEINAERPADDPRVVALLEQSDAYFAALYPAESNHLVDANEFDQPGCHFLVARQNGLPLGCVAYVRSQPEPETAEIKRLWVTDGARGLKLGQRLMTRLESDAIANNVSILRLETGDRQPEALGLYAALGYTKRGPFGDYTDDPLSLFKEKTLTA